MKVNEIEFEVEFISSTYRSYKVLAQDAESAEMEAVKELAQDSGASRAWRENAATESIRVVSGENLLID